MTKQLIIRICDKAIEWCFYAILVVAAFSNSLVEIAAWVMISSWLIKKALTRDFAGLDTWPARLMLLVWLWTVLSCFNSAYFSESFRGVFKIVKYGTLFIIAAAELRKEAYTKRMIWVLAVAAVLVCLNGLYQYFNGVDLIRHRELIAEDYLHRISSSFVHPNDFAVYLLVLVMVFISLIFSGALRASRKLPACLPLILLIVCLALTKSRGAWLSFSAAVLLYSWLKSRKLFVLVLLAFAALALVMPHSYKDRALDIFRFKDGGGTTWERIKLWEGTVNMVKEHPVLGFGVNTYSRNFPNYRPENYPDVRYSHNCYLQMAAETGIAGAGIFLAFLGSVFVSSFRRISSFGSGLRKDVAAGLSAGLVGFALNSIVDTHLYSVTLATFFYTLLGYCLALTAHEKEQ